jgi:WD40 repeat protein
LLATAGADGTVKIWASKNPSEKNSFECFATLDHSDLDRVPSNPDDKKDKPQTYALQWIDHWDGLPVADNEEASQNSFLLTSSDDFVHLWEVEEAATSEETGALNILTFREVMSLQFKCFHEHGYGVSICQVTSSGLVLQSTSQGQANQKGSTARQAPKPFGGERNPNNMIFVFEAAYCAANSLLGVALSDGTLRLINGRGVCISIVSLPGCESHLTSFAWDVTGTRLATCVATGHVILWGVNVHEGMGSLVTTCSAILEGGELL